MQNDMDRPQQPDTARLWTRFPSLPPDVLVRTEGHPDALAVELARAHDLTVREARAALAEMTWPH